MNTIHKIIFFTLILFSFEIFNAQNIEVKYIQAIENKKITKSLKPKALKGVSYKLKCNSYQSIFKLDDYLNNEIYQRNGLYVAKSGGNSTYYSNIKSNEKYSTLRGFEDNEVLVKRDVNEYKILLTKESKKIDKYICYKAIFTKKNKYSNRIKKVVAWYTTELPFPFGPIGFGGLPGLILELNYKGNLFIATKIDILNSNILINRPEGNIYTESEIKELFRQKTGVDFDKKMKKKYKNQR